MFNELNLHESINKAIQACGYTKPTPVQEKAIPAILGGADVVASAQTGTGKTAAFVLPILQRLVEQSSKSKHTRILILTPTRELAMQINKAVSMYGKFTRPTTANLIGGMPYHHQIRDLSRGADIIVATPGRLLDHINQKRVDLSHIDVLVLDEADRMLDMGFIDDIQMIAKMTPASRQTLLFSATIDKQTSDIIRKLLKEPVRIDLSSKTLTAPKIEQKFYHFKTRQEKSAALSKLINEENIFKAIIFPATKINADRLADRLCEEGFKAAALHGDMTQNKRIRTVEKLRRGSIQFLVATDVAARGLDIQDITHVINYDLPRLCEDYVHRIGRTARAEKEGVAISFVLPTELRELQRIEKYVGLKPSTGDLGESSNRSGRGRPRRENNSRSGYGAKSSDRNEKRFRSSDSDRPFRSKKPTRKTSNPRFEDEPFRDSPRGESRDDSRARPRKPRGESWGESRDDARGSRRKPRAESRGESRDDARPSRRKSQGESWGDSREGTRDSRRPPRAESRGASREDTRSIRRKPRGESWGDSREDTRDSRRQPRASARGESRDDARSTRKPKPRGESWGDSRESTRDNRSKPQAKSRGESRGEDERGTLTLRKPRKKFADSKKRFSSPLKKSKGFKKKFN